MKRYDIINALIKKFGYTSYLEIGLQDSKSCFDKIICDKKFSVDPDKKANATMCLTSDEFFERNFKEFNLIFIDGLHEKEQCYRDIKNSLKCLSEGGTIVVHDLLPTNEAMQKVPRETKEWTGDVWKAWLDFREKNDDYSTFVIDTDFGCGVIIDNEKRVGEKNNDVCRTKVIKTWEGFEMYKKSWMNIITQQEFEQWILSIK